MQGKCSFSLSPFSEGTEIVSRNIYISASATIIRTAFVCWIWFLWLVILAILTPHHFHQFTVFHFFLQCDKFIGCVHSPKCSLMCSFSLWAFLHAKITLVSHSRHHPSLHRSLGNSCIVAFPILRNKSKSKKCYFRS